MKEGWREAELKDVGTIVSGGTPKTKVASYWGGDVPWVTPADLSNYEDVYLAFGRKSLSEEGLANSSAKLMPAGSVLFSSRAPVGYVAIAANEISTNQGFKSIILSEDLDSKYVYFYLKSIKQLAESRASGTTFKELSKKAFGHLPIVYPPLPEQRAIVSKLELLLGKLDRSVGELAVAQEKLGVYRQSVLKEAFAGRLTEEWRKDHDLPSASDISSSILKERHDRYRRELEEWKLAKKEGQKVRKPKVIASVNTEKKLDDLPFTWIEVALIEIVETVSDGPFGSKLKTSDYEDEGVRVIRLENIKNLWFDDSKKTFVSEEKYELIANHTVYAGELVFSTFIADETRVTIIPPNIKFAVNKADCLRVVPTSLLDSKYLLYFLSTRNVYQQLAHNVHGATRPRINTTQLKEVKVPFCSLPEQQQIVAEIESRLSVADGLEREIDAALERVKGLRTGVLKRAFGGELVTTEEVENLPDA